MAERLEPTPKSNALPATLPPFFILHPYTQLGLNGHRRCVSTSLSHCNIYDRCCCCLPPPSVAISFLFSFFSIDVRTRERGREGGREINILPRTPLLEKPSSTSEEEEGKCSALCQGHLWSRYSRSVREEKEYLRWPTNEIA